ncbi:MAG: NAD(P)H-dependent oxidoreductase [Atopobiaceae bacterium]|nr:NAD(P)H-dependent oxidoreductase [Atopobiaceae bacterium]MCH4120335.1 NAD(P)H-dependent oxidoreductase [Atopobiaceae bacterium]MCI1389456.1 NAD(P)H-dependent oxidoreductase [Atopobiaceae bacterium]MCI1432263.1 NAD(P)H-dependent oxidoreductase [Atopobiaceae bacterium]MCI1470721.1 NAD(P)H-dependent oxidoreductase [Atopobiaceae bacterium]
MPEHVLVVYCHPYEGSFCHAVKESVVAGVERAGDECEVCDLHADGFDPAMHAADLKVYSKGEFADPLVGTYQDQLRRADRLVLVAPMWWSDIPAMLKGWIDKVMLEGFSWVQDGGPIRGCLTNIRRVDLYSTSAKATEYTVEHLGDAIKKMLLDGTFKEIGIMENGWHNLGSIGDSTLEQRQAWLAKAEQDQVDLAKA